MLDDNGEEVGDVFLPDPLVIEPVSVDASGDAQEPLSAMNDILLDQDQIQKLAISKKLILKVRFNSSMNDELSVKV